MPNPSLHNEKELLLLISQGDETAFTGIFYYYNQRLYPFVLKKVRSEAIAEELIQDIFMKLWQRRAHLHEIENPQGYIYRIAANVVLDHFKKQANEYKMLKKMKEGAPDGDDSAAAILQLKQTQQLLEEAIQQLPTQRKKIYNLREYGYSYDEIASHLGIAKDTVKNQLVTASKFIRDYLVQRGFSPIIIFFMIRFL